MASWFRFILRRLRSWRYRHRCELISKQIDTALWKHDLTSALEGLEQQLHLDCSQYVERLLFERNSRPKSFRFCLDLFMGMSVMSRLRDHHQFYLIIAASHVALRLDDVACLFHLRQRLVELACINGASVKVLTRRGRNREHPFKRLISARSCLLQVELREKNVSACLHIAFQNLELLEILQWGDLPPDVLLRSTTNLVKSILPCCLIAQQRQRVQASLLQLEQWISKDCFDEFRRLAKEDHLAYLCIVLDWLEAVKIEGESIELLEQLWNLLPSNDAPAVLAGCQRLAWIAEV